MKVAIIHEMLVKLWGAENVVKDIMELFPDSDLYTLIYDESKVGRYFPASRIKDVPTITQRIYNLTKRQRLCLPFMSKAIESIDLSSYDLVISSSSWFAHWAITKPETLFVVYYHSPARYLWDYTNEYKKDIWFSTWIKNFLLTKFMLKARQWDYLAWQRHDIAIAASKQVSSRITKYYRRDSKLIYPSVYTDEFEIWETDIKEREYYIITSALTEFKKVEIAVEAFKLIDKDLYIIWEGAYKKYLEKIAPDNVKFLWYKNRKEINEYYKKAKWFIMCWRDDFGIAPIEAMAAWIPVFALKEWWLTETNIEWLTWDFFENPKWADFHERFEKFDKDITYWRYDSQKIRHHAQSFSKERFMEEFMAMINSCMV